jgi:hypothetical protein
MNYEALKRDQLAHLCEERGIRGRSHKTKPQLIGLLQAYDVEMAELARLRARRKAGRAKKELPPAPSPGSKRKTGIADLRPAEPLTWPASMTLPSANQQAVRIAAELFEDQQAARCAAEQSQMIAADASIHPKSPKTIAQTILKYYWQFPLLYTTLNASLRQHQAMPVQFQEGQLFPLNDSKSQTLQKTQRQAPVLYARID